MRFFEMARVTVGDRAAPRAPKRTSPLSLLSLILLVLFIMEIAVLFLLDRLEGLPSPLQVFLDSGMLLALVFPALYFFAFRPLGLQIADRMRAEEDLRRAQGELEQRVLERTSELEAANAALQKEAAERKLAEEEREDLVAALQEKVAELNAMQTRLQNFVGAVTHDLRTPLTAVLGYAHS